MFGKKLLTILYVLLFRGLPFIFLLILTPGAYSQSFQVSETSAKFVNDRDYDSLLKVQYLPYAATKNIYTGDFNARFPEYKPRVLELMQSILQNPFGQLDQKYATLEPGSTAYEKVRKLYLAEISKAVGISLQNPAALYPLFEPDYSDRILQFHTDIAVQRNGDLNVTEYITVYNGNGHGNSANNDIQRGIVRDFPTVYTDKDGYKVKTGFSLKQVSRNDMAEPYITEMLVNGERIMIGKSDVFIDTGVYTYKLEYITNQQVRFDTAKDELYWNVNGNGWVFTADSISCSIRFPEGANIFEYDCYTGVQGSTEKDCRSRKASGNEIFFSSTRRMNAYEGLTVAAAIEKGVLIAPGKAASTWLFLKANYILPFLSALLLFLFGFYFSAWRKKGRDPKQGTIFPQFEPPAGLTPADTGYILDQKYRSRLFAASLVDAAVNKDLEISVDRVGTIFKTNEYTFLKPDKVEGVGTAEKISQYGFSLHEIYGEKAKSGTYNPVFKNLNTTLEKNLKDKFLLTKKTKPGARGMFALNSGFGYLGMVLFFLGLIVSFFFTVNFFSKQVFIITVFLMLAILLVNIIFMRIMKAYTKEGRAITDHILGFKMYLEQAEQRMYNMLTPPEKNLELFEKYLPYAIALGVENEWAEKFDSIIQQAIAEGYQPAYFRGSAGSFSNNFNVAAMSAGISSGLSSTISSASTPPSSSSGSSGGGSSGGGGGGGGGGGW